MSRASRSRSSLVASLATVSRAWASSRIKVSCIRNPIIARPMSRTGIKTARVLASVEAGEPAADQVTAGDDDDAEHGGQAVELPKIDVSTHATRGGYVDP